MLKKLREQALEEFESQVAKYISNRKFETNSYVEMVEIDIDHEALERICKLRDAIFSFDKETFDELYYNYKKIEKETYNLVSEQTQIDKVIEELKQ